MQDTLNKLKLIDSKIKIINKMIEDERYYGAGVTISLGIGANEYYEQDSNKNITVEVSIPETIKSMLLAMKHSLEESRKFHLSNLRRTIDEAIGLGYYR